MSLFSPGQEQVNQLAAVAEAQTAVPLGSKCGDYWGDDRLMTAWRLWIKVVRF